LPIKAYLAALDRDLKADLGHAAGRPLTSIFLGGGTPSLFPPEAIGELLGNVAAVLPLSADVEITMEANPGATEHGRLADYRAAGVSRLSLGVQSFRAPQLAALQRIHDALDAERVIIAALDAGFASVNVDLMYGLPGDTPAGAMADLRQAAALGAAQISWYQLTLEPDTAFGRHPPILPGEETLAVLEAEGRAYLAAAGYGRYEIAGYAQTGHECRHNRNYWEFGDYLGIGAGAHGKITTEAGVFRTKKPRAPTRYQTLAGTGTGFEPVAVAALPLEFLMNALRLIAGVPSTLFTARTGLAWEALAAPWARGVEQGLLADAPARICATALGLQYLDDCLALFVPEASATEGTQRET
jgi:oxygen-independent coproporphyrinogen-3 oxidase